MSSCPAGGPCYPQPSNQNSDYNRGNVLSGVSADQGVNNADGMRMAFDEVNAKGGVNGRKIRFIVEDMEYTVLTTDTDFNGPWPNRETPTAISSC